MTPWKRNGKRKFDGRQGKRKFDGRNVREQPKAKKGKFDYKTASYVKERDAKNKAIETRRKMLEEQKMRQRLHEAESPSCSSSEEDSPRRRTEKLNNLLEYTLSLILKHKPSKSIPKEPEAAKDDKKIQIVTSSDSESDSCKDGEERKKMKQKQKAKKEHVDKKMDNETSQANEDCLNKEASKNENIAVSDIKEKDEDFEDMETAQEDAGHVTDPFSLHLRYNMDDNLYRAISAEEPVREITELSWPEFGNVKWEMPVVEKNQPIKVRKLLDDEEKPYTNHGKIPSLIKTVDWNKLYVKSQIQNNLNKANCDTARDNMEDGIAFTDFQKELFSVINNYQDFYYPERAFSNADEIRFVYCLHAINHVLKTRTKILHHNAKLAKANITSDLLLVPDEYKDQGLARPKVLILVPFRHSCLKIVQTFISILFGEDKGGAVINKLRFMKDFTGNELHMSKKHPKPLDYQLVFRGNINDNFKIGLTVTRKALKLYTKFYSSDIIIASPLGLWRTLGIEKDPGRGKAKHYNFLSSIELLIIDQLDVIYMQNWLHVLDIMNHLNLQPKNPTYDIDYSRLRDWSADGRGKYYRQTLIFSSADLTRINAIFQNRCYNYAGRVKVLNGFNGSIYRVRIKTPQVFYKFDSPTYLEGIKTRMEFFSKKILPKYKDSCMNHTLIYVPCYYDYVAIRYHMILEELSFVQVNEYMESHKVAKARDMFFHSDVHFLLYSERYHFYHRPQIKGIRHLLFFQPPSYAHFYSEMCNLMRKTYQNRHAGWDGNMSVSILYDKFDNVELKRIVGTNRAIDMVLSEEKVHTVTRE